MLDDIKDFLEDYWILIWMGAVLIGFVVWLFFPRDYTLDVKRIQWEYVVHIEEYMVQHHDDERSKPSDAYNVKSHYHPRTKTWTDDDGKTHIKDDSYWTYDYDVNRWIETRSVGLLISGRIVEILSHTFFSCYNGRISEYDLFEIKTETFYI